MVHMSAETLSRSTYHERAEDEARALADRALEAVQRGENDTFEEAVMSLTPDHVLQTSPWFGDDHGPSLYGSIIEHAEDEVEVDLPDGEVVLADGEGPGGAVALLAYHAYEADVTRRALMLG